ncbi:MULTISPECIES: hypothetical protein [Kitasatospora]|uniref:Secreted protein n=1 Tax=Kitasatospora cystarginea TaxID=58350 RepID=A0ABN3E9Z6_9ACTN
MAVGRKFAVALAAAALTAGLGAAAPGATAAAPVPAAAGVRTTADCSVHSDGKLWCGNKAGANAYADRSYGSAVRGRLLTTYSWFACWGHGDRHPGGNDIWYWTQTDDGPWGNVPAVDIYTSVDPAPGLREC